MKLTLYNIFISNWQRKAISLLLGMIVWLMVNHTLTSTRTISSVSVRIINLPTGKTIDGMQAGGRLSKKLTLTLIGNTDTLNTLHPNDLEIVIDATGKGDEWGASISKKNLVSLNPEVDVAKSVSKVHHHNMIVRMTDLVTETIPVTVSHPIGEAPRGYQFLDIWPYKLSLTVSGPEDVIRKLKAKEQKITFNLNDISKAQLDVAAGETEKADSDVVSFFVPAQWRQINIPLLSEAPFVVDDLPENRLRMDFMRCELIPLDFPIRVALFYPPEYDSSHHPLNLSLKPNSLIGEKNDLFSVRIRLYAKGCDRLFTQIIKNRLLLAITVTPEGQKKSLPWGLHFINTSEMEDIYISTLMADSQEEEINSMNPISKEEYLRNRFRSYMSNLRLYTAPGEKLELKARVKRGLVEVEEISVKS